MDTVVIALVKLENLKAIHNLRIYREVIVHVVIALVKLENLKAIHNRRSLIPIKIQLLLH